MTRDDANNSRPIEIDVWGARGSRSLTPALSKIANFTSCYSVKDGEDLFVLDGGRGLSVLSSAIEKRKRFQDVKRIHLLLSHSHMDHWEGLKDAGWFWRDANGLELRIFGSEEALEAIRTGYQHPSYVPLDILAARTLRGLKFTTIRAGESRKIRGWTVRTFGLNHYSGEAHARNVLDTVGYRLRSRAGFELAYMCDHEPDHTTENVETALLSNAHVGIVDAHFSDCSQHAFGHGSQEHAAHLARRHPRTLVLAAHHGPTTSDAEIQRAHARHGNGLRNFTLAVEGLKLRWDPKRNRVTKGTR